MLPPSKLVIGSIGNSMVISNSFNKLMIAKFEKPETLDKEKNNFVDLFSKYIAINIS